MKEVDDTAMAFRLLRLHGYSVSPGKKAKQIIFVHVLLNHLTFFPYIASLTYVLLLVDVFKNFEKDGEFFCFVGQSTQAVTGMYNLNRASQISFPGEDILHRAGTFSYVFLRQREAEGALRDKWIISKDLPGEVVQSMLALADIICILKTEYTRCTG